MSYFDFLFSALGMPNPLDEWEKKKNLPVAYEKTFVWKEKKPLCKILPFIKVKKKFSKIYKIKFFECNYSSMDPENNFKVVTIQNNSGDKEVLFVEVDEDEAVMYVADKWEDRVREILDKDK